MVLGKHAGVAPEEECIWDCLSDYLSVHVTQKTIGPIVLIFLHKKDYSCGSLSL